jgi:RNA polymerase sigma factor (sigma-70 family)
MLDGIRKEATRARRVGLVARLAACELLAVQRDGAQPMTDTEEDQRHRLDVMAGGVATAMFVGVVSAASREAGEGEDAEIRRQQYARAIAALRDVSSSLPPRDRALLVLHYEEERDLEEVAVALGISYATVRRHHANVIGKLAVRLRARGVTEPPSQR